MSERYYEARPDTARVAAAAVTGTDLATSTTLLTLTNDRRILVILNSLNQAVVLTYDPYEAAAQDGFLYLEAGDNLVIDLETSGLRMKSGGVLKIYGSTPTTGTIRVQAF